LSDEFKLVRAEKHLKTLKSKLTNNEPEEDNDDMLKHLTFNIHLSSDDLEAKKNLILPYEIIG
jgi:hypothetical protein